MLKLAQPWRLCAVLIVCAIVALSPSKAQSAGQAAAARVEHIAVRGTSAQIPVGASLATPEAVEIEVQTSGAATAPDAEVISAPDRILLDFPGALPSSELKNLQVHRGAVKSIRAGLFFRNPPITRVVIDLSTPQAFQVITTQSASGQNVYLIKIGPTDSVAGRANTSSPKSKAATLNDAKLKLPKSTEPVSISRATAASSAKLQVASIASSAPITTPHAESAITTAVATDNFVATETNEQQPSPVAAVSASAKPSLVVTFENGLLRIHADQSTLAEILYEVQRQTQAEIAIPAGAEQEKVVADIGPASAREVLATLLNGSPYNFIFVGSEDKMERVILTARDGSVQ